MSYADEMWDSAVKEAQFRINKKKLIELYQSVSQDFVYYPCGTFLKQVYKDARYKITSSTQAIAHFEKVSRFVIKYNVNVLDATDEQLALLNILILTE